MRFAMTLLLLLAWHVSALAQPDYAREKKWADEVTPNIVVGDPLYLEQRNRHKFLAIFTDAPNARVGLVVVHGIGIHPDWGMVGTLRQRLPERGYATLSVQMPILAADASPQGYAPLFPEAVERLQLAAAYLEAKGFRRIAIVSHSMGSRMSQGYMIGNPPAIGAWASLGTGTGPGPLLTFAGIRAPVLDLYGANELPPVLQGAAARKASLAVNPRSRQVVIPQTDHFFTDREEAMVKEVADFLDALP